MTWLRSGGPWWGEAPWKALAMHRPLGRAWRSMRRISRAVRWLRHPRKVLYVGQPGGRRCIVSQDVQGRRYLQFGWDSAYQSVVGPGFPLGLELEYTRAMVAGVAFVEAPHRILMVGLGGGALPMFLRAALPEARIDVVDIAPEVRDVARDYFGFHEDELLKAHIGDGRRFIETPGPTYDVILLDAFDSRGTPGPMTTQEFLLATQARLTPGGAVVANVHRSPNPAFPAMLATWKATFAQLHSFDARATANRILVGLTHTEKVSRSALKARADRLGRGAPFSLRAMMARRHEDRSVRKGRGTSPDAPVLRDPVD